MNWENENDPLFPLFEVIERHTEKCLLNSELQEIKAVAVNLWLKQKIEEFEEKRQRLLDSEGAPTIEDQVAIRNMQHYERILTRLKDNEL